MEKNKNIRKENKLEDASLALTRWMGSPQSIILHTILFIAAFIFYFLGVSLDQILLILTTAVSLEAIYLSLFIQMTVNKNTQSLEEVEEDVEDIQEDVQGLEGEFEDIQENVEGLQEEIQEIGDSVENIEEEVEVETQANHNTEHQAVLVRIGHIEKYLADLQKDLSEIKTSLKK